MVLTEDDLRLALREHGVTLPHAPYFADAPAQPVAAPQPKAKKERAPKQ